MHDEFTPLLTTTDWNEEWKELQKVRRHADDAAFWDKRSATFTTKDAPNLYVEKFLGYADIRPGETVFDMGCGTGALAVPLGEAGHKVVAADFSQGMLDQMQARLDAAGVRTVFPKRHELGGRLAGLRRARGHDRCGRRLALHRHRRFARRPFAPDGSGAPAGVHHAGHRLLPPRRRAHPGRRGAALGARTRLPVRVQHPGQRGDQGQRCATSTAPATIHSPPPRTPTRSWPP